MDGRNLTFVRRASWELRTLVGMSPPLARLLVRSGEMVTAETAICIEGYPRSGNTFAVIAFQSAQPTTVSIAHHVHAPAPVITAVRMGKPALVLVREPEEAVLSFVVRSPHLSVRQALRAWNRFYGPLMRYQAGFVVGPFKDVVSDLGALIKRINERFGTGFREFEHGDRNVNAVMAELDRWDANTFGDGEEFELGRARPSELREQVKEELRSAYRGRKLAAPRAHAERLYAELVRGAGAGDR